MTRFAFLALSTLFILAIASPLRAGEPPRTTWAKAKCAVCHGADGRGDTPAGKKYATPDLRGQMTQKRPDDELMKLIRQGHQNMPTFGHALTDQHVTTLLYFIRNLPK